MECGKRGEKGDCHIPGNATKHSVKCPQTFREMSPNIAENIRKHTGTCCKTSLESIKAFR